MNSLAELRLRQLALALGVLLVLQVLYTGVKLVFRSEPDPIAPAASTLQLGAPGYGSPDAYDQASHLVARPLFWPGRQPYTPAVVSEAPAPPPPEPEVDASAIEALKLLGVYAGGGKSGIIVADGQERRRLSINDSIEGWKFTLMSLEGAIFEKGSESRMLLLEHALPAAPKAGKARGQQRAARPGTRKSNNGGD